MDRMKTILTAMEKKSKMEYSLPASKLKQEKLKTLLTKVPEGLMEFYGVTDGIEIYYTGTSIKKIDKVLAESNANTSMSIIGSMAMGDEVGVTSSGTIAIIDHETNEILLEYASFYEYLQEELVNLDYE